MTADGLLAVTLVQAFETADPPSESWTGADRRWATQAARDALASSDGSAPGLDRAGARRPGRPLAAAPKAREIEARIERRARLALDRLVVREPAVEGTRPAHRRNAGAARAGRGTGLGQAVALVAAFGAGLAADAIGAGGRIDLLAPPLWGVLVWNVAVYLAIGVAALRRTSSPTRRDGPVRRAFAVWADRLGSIGRTRESRRGSEAVWRRFDSLWRHRSAPIWRARLAAGLHGAAALFALGLIAGLYLRGLVLDYRVGWESTFLDAGAVRGLVGTVLRPASVLDRIPLPDLAGIAAMRGAHGSSAGAPAAPWIHLFATTLALGVVLPRLLLAACERGIAGWRRHRLALPIAGDSYLERLARELTGRLAHVAAVPFAMQPSADAERGLAEALAGAFGAAPIVRIALPVRYGDESIPALDEPGTTDLLALFDLASTPEPETHGRFIERLRERATTLGAQVRAAVDETRFRRRFAAEPARLGERRQTWQRFADDLGLPVTFVDLSG